MKHLYFKILLIIGILFAGYSYFIEPNTLEVTNYTIQDKELSGVSRLGETQQFFKCKNSAILCKVNAKVCPKVQEKSLFVRFEILNSQPFLALC